MRHTQTCSIDAEVMLITHMTFFIAILHVHAKDAPYNTEANPWSVRHYDFD